MSEVTNVLIAVRTASELLSVVQRAVEAGKDITEEQLKAATDEVFNRLKESDQRWQDAGK